MLRTRVSVIFVAVTAVACGGSGNSATPGSKNIGEALTTGVQFEHGVLKPGLIKKPDPGAQKAQLLVDASPFAFAPGQSSLIPLDVDNPDQDTNGVSSTLMQFDGSTSHVEVSAKDSQADAGTDQQGLLHLEFHFKVDADICKQLCNRSYASKMIFAVTLGDGSVSQHAERDVELDCTGDGDPKQCTSADKKAAAMRDAGSAMDAGAGARRDASTSGGASSANDASTLPDASRDAGMAKDASSPSPTADAGGDSGEVTPPPQISALTPLTATTGDAFSLSIMGSGFTSGAVVYFDEQALATQYVSDSELSADVPSSATQTSGDLAVYVQNVASDANTKSNRLYVRVTPAASGAPVIYDYSPDNGVAGDTILIIASNLAGQTLTIKDAKGTTLTPGALSSLSWPTAGTADTVEVVLPSNIASGPITVTNSMGSFKGKIFNVGQNLTRTSGTTLDSSSEYNTSNWSRASGADNSLATSFFTAHGDCASMTTCTMKPWYKITFASDQAVARLAMRGNREYQSGYDFLSGQFQVLDASDAVLWQGSYDLPEPDRDLDIRLPQTYSNARSVKFLGQSDESDEPGFSEIEVFGP